MPAFEYSALDGRGHKKTGLITADSELAARRELRLQHLAPLALRQADSRRGVQAPGTAVGQLIEYVSRRDLGTRDLMLITRQLAALIEAGMPVEESLDLVGRQLEKHAMRRIIMAVRARVTEGSRLADAMAAAPGSFPPVYRALIAAGEASGSLGMVLSRLSDHLETEDAVRNKVVGALVHPAVLAVVAIGVITMLMLFVVPRLAEQFTGMGVSLPTLTRSMIAISSFLATSWPWIAAGLAGSAIAFILAYRQPGYRRIHDAVVVRVPLIGAFLRQVEAAAFARTMSILITSGTVLPDALRAAGRAGANHAFREMIAVVVSDVESGRGLSDALTRGGWIPSLVIYMVAAGERSGRLDEMFGRAADQLGRDIDSSIAVSLSLLEPGIILVLGLIVVLIVLSILLPILQLNTLVLG
ncbi:type II secretion system F family protein [Maricaulis salignorans]|uniref:Type II secretion system protein F (GspF) n=1 Tax=Maricaulis salignorans TaxID=144026 RepID=A0A1G9LTE5_9PROT|nr:type II secretion system F family protein [Maricaulis salignorans]SDL65198.1 type II secretion system protein F (GspF) [Maricaulis salignorans]